MLVYATQVNSTFRARWLASSEVISQVLFTSKEPRKYKMAFVGILSQIKLLFGPLVENKPDIVAGHNAIYVRDRF